MTAILAEFAGTITYNDGIPLPGLVTVATTSAPAGAVTATDRAGRFSVSSPVDDGDTVTLTIQGFGMAGVVSTQVVAGPVAGQLFDLTRDIGLPSLPPDTDHNVPAGGTTGESLLKASNADYDTDWGAVAGGLVVAGEIGDFAAAGGHLYYVDATGGAVAATLPVPANGIQVVVKQTDASGNAVTVLSHGGESIDGSSSPFVIAGQDRAFTFTGDGSNWQVSAGYVPSGASGQVAFTQKGPFPFTFADRAELVAGVTLWDTVLGDLPMAIWPTVPRIPFDGGTGATVTADIAPTLPLTIVAANNDTFVYTGTAGGGSPETFTIAPGTYTTLAGLAVAVGAAVGSADGEAFSSLVAVTDDGTHLVFSMLTVGVAAFAQNDNTLTEGNGGAAAIGVTAPPDTFSGGVGPQLQVKVGSDPLTPAADLSRLDVANYYQGLNFGPAHVPGSFANYVFSGAAANTTYAATAGVPYVAKFTSDPGAMTQGECWIYALVFAALMAPSV